jgi:hypothetical protein
MVATVATVERVGKEVLLLSMIHTVQALEVTAVEVVRAERGP